MPQRQHPSRDTGATYYKTDLVLVAVGQRFKALAVRLALPPNRAQPSAVLRRHISPAKQRALGAGVARARSATAEEPGRCSTSDAQAARLSPRKGPRQRRPCTSARAFADSRRTHLHQLALIHELAAQRVHPLVPPCLPPGLAPPAAITAITAAAAIITTAAA